MIGLANRSARPKTCRSRGNQTAGIGTTGSIAAIIAGILLIGQRDLQSSGKSRKEMSMSSRHSESSTNPSSRKRKSESARTKLAKAGMAVRHHAGRIVSGNPGRPAAFPA